MSPLPAILAKSQKWWPGASRYHDDQADSKLADADTNEIAGVT